MPPPEAAKLAKPHFNYSKTGSYLKLGIERARRPKGEHRTLTCPFFECLKEFAETGNLKTHIRTHVISLDTHSP